MFFNVDMNYCSLIFGIMTNCFDFGQKYLENDFVDAAIYICYFLLFLPICRDVVRTLVNI